jgi:biotin operon repressor
MEKEKEKYISTADLARIFGITRQAVQKMMKSEEGIKIKKIGSGFLYNIDTFPSDIKNRIEKEQKETAKKAVNLVSRRKKILILKKSSGRPLIDYGAILTFLNISILF